MKPETTFTDRLGVDIQTAARLVGVSRAQFYRLFIKSGKIRPVRTGKRDRVIDYAELTAAWTSLRDQLRAAEPRIRGAFSHADATAEWDNE